MNERIKELLAKAGIYQPERFDGIDGSNQLEKFAELIVRECIQVGGPEDSYTDDWFMAKAHSVAKIKQHFGVEE